MNNLTSLFLSHPKEFMKLINRLRKDSLQSEITDEEDFLRVMLTTASESVSFKKDIYKVYIVYEYLDTETKSVTVESTIKHLDYNPFTESGILSIYQSFTNYKGFIMKNLILLEE